MLQVELAGKHIIINASERKMNVKFSRFIIVLFLQIVELNRKPVLIGRSLMCVYSESEAEKWQRELESQIHRVAQENAHQGRVLMVAVCKLKAQVAHLAPMRSFHFHDANRRRCLIIMKGLLIHLSAFSSQFWPVMNSGALRL